MQKDNAQQRVELRNGRNEYEYESGERIPEGKRRQSKAKQRALMLKFPTEFPIGLERIASPFGWLQKHLKKRNANLMVSTLG